MIQLGWLNLPWMAYGYGVYDPPPNIDFCNAIANSGEMVKPRFIEKIGAIGELPQQMLGGERYNPNMFKFHYKKVKI